jgi:hypothetical protein
VKRSQKNVHLTTKCKFGDEGSIRRIALFGFTAYSRENNPFR